MRERNLSSLDRSLLDYRIVARDIAIELARHLDVEDHAREGLPMVHDHQLVDDAEREAAGQVDLEDVGLLGGTVREQLVHGDL